MSRTPLTLWQRPPIPVCITAGQTKAKDKQYVRQTFNLPNMRKLAGGFTVLELLVVSILMTLVVMIITQFWVWFAPGITDIIARGHTLCEARMAMQNLAADFGDAVGATAVGSDRLVLCKDGGDFPNGAADWSAPDVMVDYSVSGNLLYRSDLSTGAVFVVADSISGFMVEQITPDLFRIILQLTCRDFDRELTFMWSRP